MYNDMMYCRNCQRTFKDMWIIRNTRTEQVLTNCPYCRSRDTINATQFIEKYELLSIQEKGGLSKKIGKPVYQAYKRFYKFLKRKQKIYNLKRYKNDNDKS